MITVQDPRHACTAALHISPERLRYSVHLPLLMSAPSIIVEQLSEPHDACVGHNDRGSLSIGTFLCNLEVSASGIAFQVQVKQLRFDLHTRQVSLSIARRECLC